MNTPALFNFASAPIVNRPAYSHHHHCTTSTTQQQQHPPPFAPTPPTPVTAVTPYQHCPRCPHPSHQPGAGGHNNSPSDVPNGCSSSVEHVRYSQQAVPTLYPAYRYHQANSAFPPSQPNPHPHRDQQQYQLQQPHLATQPWPQTQQHLHHQPASAFHHRPLFVQTPPVALERQQQQHQHQQLFVTTPRLTASRQDHFLSPPSKRLQRIRPPIALSVEALNPAVYYLQKPPSTPVHQHQVDAYDHSTVPQLVHDWSPNPTPTSAHSFVDAYPPQQQQQHQTSVSPSTAVFPITPTEPSVIVGSYLDAGSVYSNCLPPSSSHGLPSPTDSSPAYQPVLAIMSDEAQQTHATTPPEAAVAPAPPVEHAQVEHSQVEQDAAAALHEEVSQAAPTDDTTHAAIQSAAEAQDPQQPSWNPATGEYYYPAVAQQAGNQYLPAGDYSINGVMSLPTEHYVTATGEDYNNVAATLSNWAEANPTDDANSGLALVAPPVNGDTGMATHANGEVQAAPAPAPLVTEKPKKLVLACHFCRGRKLKCDGNRPFCSHCNKRSIQCTYDETVRRRGPGKRTKEMRERAAREAEAAGLGLTAESIAHLAAEAGPSALPDLTPKKAGRKRKSEAVDEAEKKARLEEEQAAAHAAVAAAAAAVQGHLAPHEGHEMGHEVAHEMQQHDVHGHDVHGQEVHHHEVHELQHGHEVHELPQAHDVHELQQSHEVPDLPHDLPHSHDVHDLPHSLEALSAAHEGMIDPALTGEGGLDGNGTVLDLPPLEPGTLGQVIQSLNGQQ